MYGISLPLGTSKYNSVFAPSFEANFIKGNVVPQASINHDSGSFGIKRIPQIEMEVTFHTSFEQKKNNNPNSFDVDDITTYTDNEPTVTIGLNGPPGNPMISKVYENGTYIKVVEDYILLDLNELNSIVGKNGFELEIFEIDGPDTAPDQNLRRLKFTNFSGQDSYNSLIDIGSLQPIEQISSPSQVEYYFEVRLDSEIDPLLITQGHNQNIGDSILEPCEDAVEGET